MAKLNLGATGGFVRHYGNELAVIAATLQGLVDHAPLDAQDKERLSDGLAQLQVAATRIAEGAAKVTAEVTAKVRKSDIEAAVGAYLKVHPEIITAAIEANAKSDGSNAGA